MLCAGQLGSSTLNWDNDFYGPGLVYMEHCHLGTGEDFPQTVFMPQSWKHTKISLYAVALRFPSMGTRAQSQHHKKNNLHTKSTLKYRDCLLA